MNRECRERAAKDFQRTSQKPALQSGEDGRMSKSEMLVLLDEMQRICNSRHDALMVKFERLRSAVAAQDNN